MTHILFRVDASPLIGGGHVMRCLSLAGILRARGAKITFASASLSTAQVSKILAAEYGLFYVPALPQLPTQNWERAIIAPERQRVDAEHAVTAAGDPDWIVVDHYLLDAAWEARAQEAGSRLLVVDDLANRPHACDLLLDQTLGRSPSDYAALVPKHCTLLLGSQFALLRPDYAAERGAALDKRRMPRSSARILVSLGTSDVAGMTAPTVAALRAAGLEMPIDVVLSNGAPSLRRVEGMAANDASLSVHVDTDQMPALIAAADLAIGAAGTSALERCCLGCPSVTLVLADNQRHLAHVLEEAGASRTAASPFDAGRMAGEIIADEWARMRMIATAAAIADGAGGRRIADILTGSSDEDRQMPVRIRPAEERDSTDVWLWRNDPTTRAASQAQAPIAWPEHAAWWARATTDVDRRLLIGEAENSPVAIVRFDREGDGTYQVSINVRPDGRGRGLGSRVLKDACFKFLAERPGAVLTATIHDNNVASERVFAGLGFVRMRLLDGAGFRRYRREAGARQSPVAPG